MTEVWISYIQGEGELPLYGLSGKCHFFGGRFLIGTEIFGVDFYQELRSLGSIFRAQNLGIEFL